VRALQAVADRMVGLVVPKTPAGACCPPDPYREFCYCIVGLAYFQTCQSNCACHDYCGECQIVGAYVTP